MCDIVEPWEHGTAVRCTRFPEFWNYNSLRVEGADPGVSADALVHAADVLQGDLAHRQIEVEDEAAGARLRPAFEALGWAAERFAWLRLSAALPPGPPMAEATFAATRPLRLEWARAVALGKEAGMADRLADMEEAVAAIRGTRALLARDEAGTPTGFAAFVADAGGAEIDQVYVSEALRDRGLGGALVSGAVRAGGAPETFIVADDEGDSKRLYERLGFEPVWAQHVFTRRPG